MCRLGANMPTTRKKKLLLDKCQNDSQTVYTEVEVDLSEFQTDDLVEKLENREYDYHTQGVDADAMRELLEQIWMRRRQGQDYQTSLDQLIWGVLGKVL